MSTSWYLQWHGCLGDIKNHHAFRQDLPHSTTVIYLLAYCIKWKNMTFLSQCLCRLELLWVMIMCYWLISLCVIQINDDGHKGGKDGQMEADSQNQCYYCKEVFQNVNTLRRHCRQAHGKDRCHVCILCNKAFKRATHLKVKTSLKTVDRDDKWV